MTVWEQDRPKNETKMETNVIKQISSEVLGRKTWHWQDWKSGLKLTCKPTVLFVSVPQYKASLCKNENGDSSNVSLSGMYNHRQKFDNGWYYSSPNGNLFHTRNNLC